MAELGHRVALSKFLQIVTFEGFLSINHLNVYIFLKIQKRFVCYVFLDLNVKSGENWPKTVELLAQKTFSGCWNVILISKHHFSWNYFFKIYLLRHFWS